jgi:hypothetical protein
MLDIRKDVRSITLNIMGRESQLKLRTIPSTEPPAQPPHGFEPVKIWQQHLKVTANIIEKALINNGYDLATVLYNESRRPGQNEVSYKTKVVCMPKVDLENGLYQRTDLTEEQLDEVRRLLKLTYKFCHAQSFAGPVVPNIQVALLQPVNEKPERQLTVRNHELTTALSKDITPDEKTDDITRRFASRLVGRP